MARLRQWERQSHGRLPAPSACCADSQSVKTATQGEDVGFDGQKKIKGRTRHILVDTLGLIVAVVVTAANMDDRLGLVTLVERYCASGVKRLRKIWVDSGYQAQWLWDWVYRRTSRSTCAMALSNSASRESAKFRGEPLQSKGWQRTLCA